MSLWTRKDWCQKLICVDFPIFSHLEILAKEIITTQPIQNLDLFLQLIYVLLHSVNILPTAQSLDTGAPGARN